MKHKNLIPVCFAILLACSCTTNNSSVLFSVVECPIDVREQVVVFAKEYAERETYFEFGGRDFLEKEGILEVDCSGFIVRVYQYAVKNTKYSLLFDDTNVSSFYHYFTIPIDNPTPGDIIFMGSYPNDQPSHMSIYLRADDENVYFIDCTIKEEEDIDGVSLRFYEKDDPKFLYFARLLVKL